MRTTLILALALTACSGDAPPVTPDEPAEQVDPLATPIDVAAAPADATKTDSGLAYKVLVQGEGDTPKSERSKVKVHYTGWTTDGERFDSSVERGEPSSFGLNGVIAGWTEGVQLMKVGDKTRFWIPEELAYKGRAGKPAGMLVFDIELIEIDEPPEPWPVPADVAKAPESATTTGSGLAYVVLEDGAGAQPTAGDAVTVHYAGWLTSGEPFDSSVDRGEPATFPLNGVIAGWTEGLQTMKPGGKTRFWIPEELAYKGRAGKPPGMLVFDVQLIDVHAPPSTPDNVATVPADAKKTESGLAYVVLSAGSGDKHPAATDVVEVHYTGWTTDGEMFDSSVMRGEPATFPLNRVIPGWTEGVQLLKAGDKARFWIPEALAYKGKEGPPKGMLVFDIELLNIR